MSILQFEEHDRQGLPDTESSRTQAQGRKSDLVSDLSSGSSSHSRMFYSQTLQRGTRPRRGFWLHELENTRHHVSNASPSLSIHCYERRVIERKSPKSFAPGIQEAIEAQPACDALSIPLQRPVVQNPVPQWTNNSTEIEDASDSSISSELQSYTSSSTLPSSRQDRSDYSPSYTQSSEDGCTVQLQFSLECANEEDLRNLMDLFGFFIRTIRFIALAYVTLTGFSTLLPSVSTLLPDNIQLYDALGRLHNLRFSEHNQWSILAGRLKTYFKDCPGYEKVMSQQFIITDMNNPEQDIGEWNFNSVVLKGRRFKMSIIMRQLVMKDGICVICNIPVRNVSESTFTCPSCGLFHRSSSHSRKHFSLDQLRITQKSYMHSQCLQVPVVPQEDTLGWELWHVARSHSSKLREDLISESELTKNARHVVEFRAEVKATETRDSALNSQTNVAVSGEAEQSPGTNNTEEPTEHDLPSQDEESIIRSNPGIDDSELAIEEEDVHNFKGISIRQATHLYDAALSKNLSKMHALLAHGVRADRQSGYWGTPLTAAAFVQFEEGVDLLLKNEAHSLSLAVPINGPLQAAACFGTLPSYINILTHAFKHLDKRPKETMTFQIAIDGALFALVDAGFVRVQYANCDILDRIFPLLYLGANPFQKMSDDRTAFSIAVARSRSDLSIQFLAEAWKRNIFSRSDATAMRLVLSHGDISFETLPTWIRSCCQNLQMRRTELVETKVFKFLNGRLFSAPQIMGSRKVKFSKTKFLPAGGKFIPTDNQTYNGIPLPRIDING